MVRQQLTFTDIMAQILVLALLMVILGPKFSFASDHHALKSIKKTPLGLPELDYKNISLKKIELGKKLFFDKRLSRDNTISCASCHKPKEYFTEHGKATSTGFQEQKNRRNTPSIINSAFYERLHHDGRETSLETQFLLPLTSHDEMASRSVGYVIQKLNWLPEYKALFEAAFDRPSQSSKISLGNIGEALAAYQKTLISANSRFDRWYFGKKENALTEIEKQGFKLFTEKAECESCHTISEKYALFTDQAFHDIGHGWQRNHKKPGYQQDKGRYEVTLDPLDLWRYRTPSLRNIAKTAPYMHDGAFKTLEEVIRFYNKGGAPHTGQDQRIKKLNLTKQEIAALVAFLKSLTGDNLNELIKRSTP